MRGRRAVCGKLNAKANNALVRGMREFVLVDDVDGRHRAASLLDWTSKFVTSNIHTWDRRLALPF